MAAVRDVPSLPWDMMSIRLRYAGLPCVPIAIFGSQSAF